MQEFVSVVDPERPEPKCFKTKLTHEFHQQIITDEKIHQWCNDMFCDSAKTWNVPTVIYAELTSSGNYMQLQHICKWLPRLLLILIWDDWQLRVQAQMNRKCLSAAQRLRCKNEDENVTEAGMIHVIYLTWLTVITAALTFLLCAQNWDPPSNQRLMSTLAALILSPAPTTRSDIWCENKTTRLSQKRKTE